jgi:hypothetical protein
MCTGSVTYEEKKKGGNLLRNFTSPEKVFLFIYDVIVKQNFKNGPLITTYSICHISI